ncbi:MAG TPA: lipoate--protein ligase family protein [Verrucomicrobiae bacterium]|nr:lipoate--protein ligase family protein [Verrucomicrobiae bacterium]
MKWFDRTFDTPQENLACDEALLDWCEEDFDGEILRFWMPRQHFVVLGYSNKAQTEVNLDSCRALGVPVFRRCSGGGTVLQGPGCLNYSLILRIRAGSPLDDITQANALVMNRQRTALNPLLGGNVLIQGYTDLTLGGLKFSGNSQRRKRRCLLFHGSFLFGLDLDLLQRVLPMPSKQPGYRAHRSHAEFLINVSLPPAEIQNALRKAWSADEPLLKSPNDKIAQLARDKYATDEWNLKF